MGKVAGWGGLAQGFRHWSLGMAPIILSYRGARIVVSFGSVLHTARIEAHGSVGAFQRSARYCSREAFLAECRQAVRERNAREALRVR